MSEMTEPCSMAAFDGKENDFSGILTFVHSLCD